MHGAMKDRVLHILVYCSTPFMLVAGLLLLYFIVGDHPWFPYMAGGYALMLLMLYTLKISVHRKLLRRQTRRNAVEG